MNLLLSLVGRLGLPEPFRRIVAVAGLAVAALLALLVLKSGYDHRIIARNDARIAAQGSAARAQADAERASDGSVNIVNSRDLNHAIDTAPQGGTLSPAAHALACERLRKLGRVPAACRSGGGD